MEPYSTEATKAALKRAESGRFPAATGSGLRPVALNTPVPPVKPPRVHPQDIPEWAALEIRETWKAARDAGGEMQAFRIFERMTDRLGFGRIKDNPPLYPNSV